MFRIFFGALFDAIACTAEKHHGRVYPANAKTAIPPR
jgi:hypothetical protein